LNSIHIEFVKTSNGYELTNEKGFGSPLAITTNLDETEVGQKLNNYDIFSSAEVNISEHFSLRPGSRVSFTNLFENQYVFSLSTKYLFKNNLELRTILGSANRTPNYDELYTYFVDVNHNVQGNPNLNPENGISAFVHLKKQFAFSNEKLLLKNKLSLSYLNVTDRIELIILEQSPLAYQYNNIDSYKSFGLFSENSLQYQRFRASLGVSVLGISKILDSSTNSKDDLLYNLQLNSNINYVVPDWNSSFSLYFKHVGKQHQFVEQTNDDGDQEYFKGTTDAFSWLDFTVKKSFLDKKFETTFGVRNILDINTINTTAISGSTHSDSVTSLSLGYGRSYFLKLAYNLNI